VQFDLIAKEKMSTENEREKKEEEVPETVKTFVVLFNRRILRRNPYEIQNMYTVDFNRITERFFKASAWPNPDSIAPLVENDENFLVLYKELYFRHVYSVLQPSVDDRFDSFQNYIDLFNIILGLNLQDPELELPPGWLWDMIDEFIYQFQSFHQFRSRVKDLSQEEIPLLKRHEHVWSAQTVIRYLHALARKASIKTEKKDEKKEEKSDDKNKKEEETDKKEDVHPFFKTLAQFSAIGLCRVNCLLSDYTTALKVLEPIDLNNKRSVYNQVMSAHFTLYYYMGLAYLMLRRYGDAGKSFSTFLSYISRNEDGVPRMLNKRVEQMHGLLGISVAMSPQRLNDNLMNALRDKLTDKLQRLQKGEISAFEDVYSHSCPKFISPCVPNFASDINLDQEPQKLQLKIFLHDIKQREKLPEIYSYLKMCTAINTTKLAAFLKTDDDSLNQMLLNLKHKTRNLRWKGGAASSGKWQSSSEVDFVVNADLIQVAEYKAPRRYGEYFIRHILKYEDLIQDIKNTAVAQTFRK